MGCLALLRKNESIGCWWQLYYDHYPPNDDRKEKSSGHYSQRWGGRICGLFAIQTGYGFERHPNARKKGFELMTKSFSSIYKFFHFTRKLHLSEHSKFHLQSSDRDTLNVVMHFFLDTQENSPILHSHKIGRSHRSIYFTDSNECCLVWRWAGIHSVKFVFNRARFVIGTFLAQGANIINH